MYDQRVKVFIGTGLAVLLVCVLRLAQMQLLTSSEVQDEIAKLKVQRGQSKQLKTLRGKILDRKGRVLAADTPRFRVYINYQLSSYLDDRVVRAKIAEAQRENADLSLEEVRDLVDNRRQELEHVIAECSRLGAGREQIEAVLTTGNNRTWNLRSYLAWYRGDHDPNLMAKYNNRRDNVPFGEAMADLERQFPDPNERYRRIARINDVPEVRKVFPLVELGTEDSVFAAQVEFRDINDVQVLPTGHRYYPYAATAAQTIGWVGQATQERDIKLFQDDPLASYLDGEDCGREGGVEYVCETILRGRRGELVYDIDRQLVREIDTQFGRDVQLTLDVELQKQIEEWLGSPAKNPDYCHAGMAAAVIDVATGDILALASLPTYDLNSARNNCDDLRIDANHPLTNRAIDYLYAPGSAVKPLILIAALEAGLIAAEEPISCPAVQQAGAWPRCWIFKQLGAGHDGSWVNNARNAIKGSCNVYFSHLADRLDPRQLQEWLFRFGYGRQAPLSCPAPESGAALRSLLQTPGQIGSSRVASHADIVSFDQIPPLKPWHKRLFGIGHGDLRVTPLQVANTFATLARGGLHRAPRLFLRPPQPPAEAEDLRISPASIAVACDGMHAVVSEPGGTAYDYFKGSELFARGIRIYGKTGSTENPENAWFAGYAEDRRAARIAIAVVVEGGKHGGSDAAPMGRAIFELCAAAGYLGN